MFRFLAIKSFFSLIGRKSKSAIDASAKQVNENMLVRRCVLLWAIVLVTWFITSPPAYLLVITDAGAVAYCAVIGILSSVIGFYQWSRLSDKKIESETKRKTKDAINKEPDQ